jgi:hypothetical protein
MQLITEPNKNDKAWRFCLQQAIAVMLLFRTDLALEMVHVLGQTAEKGTDWIAMVCVGSRQQKSDCARRLSFAVWDPNCGGAAGELISAPPRGYYSAGNVNLMPAMKFSRRAGYPRVSSYF